MTEQGTTQRKRGCLFYTLILGAVLLLILVVGAYFGFRYAKQLVNDFTDDRPAVLPKVHLSELEMSQLQDRIATFREAVQDGQAVEPLGLAADDVNALIATNSFLASLKGQIYVSIPGNELHAQISFPAVELGLPLRDRYVNADGVFAIRLRDSELAITAESLSARGKPLPETIMRQLRSRNLASQMNDDPSVKRALHALQDIQVKDGKLVLVPKKE